MCGRHSTASWGPMNSRRLKTLDPHVPPQVRGQAPAHYSKWHVAVRGSGAYFAVRSETDGISGNGTGPNGDVRIHGILNAGSVAQIEAAFARDSMSIPPVCPDYGIIREEGYLEMR